MLRPSTTRAASGCRELYSGYGPMAGKLKRPAPVATVTVRRRTERTPWGAYPPEAGFARPASGLRPRLLRCDDLIWGPRMAAISW